MRPRRGEFPSWPLRKEHEGAKTPPMPGKHVLVAVRPSFTLRQIGARSVLQGAAVMVMVLAVAGCRPSPSVGQFCTEAPCGAGLECVDGVCLPPLPMPEPPPPCESADDCSIEDNVDGRFCDDGTCEWVECQVDEECGTRICDRGACAPRQLCVIDGDCKDGGICVDGTCRSPCLSDQECAAAGGGGPLGGAACVEGRCLTTCAGDFLCFGGICEEGVCQDPQCADEEDCVGENLACNGGRCEGFTPCGQDEDCFDPDFLCNDLGRCEMRPACIIDEDCGPEFLCIAAVCRPAETCGVDDDCLDSDDECVAGRCVASSGCRTNLECGANQICALGACTDDVEVAAAQLAVVTAHGACDTDGSGGCQLVLYPGEQTTVRVGTFDDDDRPVRGSFTVTSSDTTVGVLPQDGSVVLTAGIAGSRSISFGGPGLTAGPTDLTVTVVDTGAPAAIRVLVVDGSTGAPSSGTTVRLGDQTEMTSAAGLASFATQPGPDAQGVTALIATPPAGQGIAVLGLALNGNLRVVLPATQADVPLADVAGASGMVNSSGDEPGPVGYGLALLGQPSIQDASLEALFGPAYTGTLEAPLVGPVPVALPAAVMLEATLPFVMAPNPIVRDRVYTTTAAPGRRTVTGFELRQEVGDLLGRVLGASPIDLALDLAQDAEGMDAELIALGNVPALSQVADDDDVNANGDLAERIPDWDALPTFVIAPERKPPERVGVFVGAAPADARAELFAVGGLLAPGSGFVPTGLAVFTADDPLTQQIRVLPPEGELSAARRALRVQAVYDDPRLSSSAYWRGQGFSSTVSIGDLLAPPEGTFFLDDVPMAGARSLVLPASLGATTYVVEVETTLGAHLVVIPSAGGTGRSIALAQALIDGATLGATHALRRDGPSDAAATLTLFLEGTGPMGTVFADATGLATAAP